jgi:uridine nucleosidase
VSTVHGNATLDRVTLNCLRILRAMNKTNIPVHAGQPRGIIREHISAKDIHGESGLDGTDILPQLTLDDKPSEKKAVLAMAEGILAQEKGQVMLVSTGPLTNAAILLTLFPEVVDWLKGMVIMGGAVNTGNVTRTAEFNIWVI